MNVSLYGRWMEDQSPPNLHLNGLKDGVVRLIRAGILYVGTQLKSGEI